MNFFRAIGITVVGRFLFIILSFTTLILLTHTFIPKDVGVFNYINSLTSIILLVLGLGLTSTIAYYAARQKHYQREILSIVLFGSILLGAVGATVVGTLFHFFPGIFPELRWTLLVTGLMVVPGLLFCSLLRAYFLGLPDIFLYNVIEFIIRVIPFSVVLLAFLLQWDIGRVIRWQSFAMLAIVVVIIAYVTGYSRTASIRDFNTRLFFEMVSLGVRPYLIIMASYLVLRVDVLFVDYYHGLAAVGLYTVAVTVAEYALLIPNILGDILFTHLANTDAGHEITLRVFRVTAVLMAVVLMVAGFAAKVLFVTLFGSSYAGSVAPLQILLMGVLLFGLSQIITNDLSSRGYPWFQTLIWIPTVMLNIVGNTAFIPRWGISGAALSSSLSYGFLFLLLIGYYKRRMRVPWLAFRPQWNDVMITIRSVRTVQRKVLPSSQDQA